MTLHTAVSAGQELAGEWRRLVTVTLYAWLHLTMFIPKGTHYTTACFRLLCLEVYLLYSYTVMALVASFDQSCFGALVAPLPQKSNWRQPKRQGLHTQVLQGGTKTGP